MIWQPHPRPGVMARRDEIAACPRKLLPESSLIPESSKAAFPDLNVAGNIGCTEQSVGDPLPVMHTLALLNWKAVGSHPPGVPG